MKLARKLVISCSSLAIIITLNLLCLRSYGQDCSESGGCYRVGINVNGGKSGGTLGCPPSSYTQGVAYKITSACDIVTGSAYAQTEHDHFIQIDDNDCGIKGDTSRGSFTIDCGSTGLKADVIQSNCFDFYFRIYAPPDAKIKKGTITLKAHSDADCMVCPDGVDMNEICDECHFESHSYDYSCTIECDPGSVNDCACGANTSSSGSTEVNNDSVNFSMSLGPAGPNSSAGTFSCYALIPSPDLATPSSLQYPSGGTGIQVLTNANGIIRQVLTPLCLANVLTNSSYQYQVQFFYLSAVGSLDANGFYTTNAPAYTTITIKNPDETSANNRLQITESRDGQVRDFLYTYIAVSNRLDLLEPDGSTVISTWSVRDASDSSGNTTNYYRQISANGTIFSYNKKKYSYVAAISDKLLMQETDGYGSSAQITTYGYYAGTVVGVSNLLQRVDYYDGRWVYNKYDSAGRKVREYSAYGNNPPPAIGIEPDPLVDHCQVTDYAYSLNAAEDGIDYYDGSNPWSICKTTVSLPVLGDAGWVLHEVSRIYARLDSSAGGGEQRVCTKPGAHWDDPSNLTMGSAYIHQGDDYKTVPDWIANTDGTFIFYSYPDQYTTIESSSPDGRETTTTVDDVGNPVSQVEVDTTTGVILSKKSYSYKDSSGNYYDPLRRSYDVTDLAGRTTRYRYNTCCGVSAVTDSDGVEIDYSYDILKRQVANTVYRGGANGITTSNILDAAGRVLKTQRIGTDNSIITLSQSQYDTLGNVILQTNALNGVASTTNVVINNQLYITNIYADGGKRIEQYYRDGRLQSVTGTAVHSVAYQYGVEQDPETDYWVSCTLETKLNVDGTPTSEWIKNYTDGAGQNYKTIYAASAQPYPNEESYYNQRGQCWKKADPDNVITLYTYNSLNGKLEYTISALSDTARQITDYDTLVNSLSTLKQNGVDRISRIEQVVRPASGNQPDLVEQDKYVWLNSQTDDNGTLVVQSQVATSGLTNWSIIYGEVSISLTNYNIISPGSSRTEITTAPDGSYAVYVYSYGRLSSSVNFDANNHQLGSTSYTYDAHERQYQSTDIRNGTTAYAYNDADQITSVAAPNPGSCASTEVTTMLYDNMQRPYSVIQPDGTTVNTLYLLTGEMGKQYGSRTYPVAYSYDYAGRMKTMTNWSNYAGNSGVRVTAWNYDSNRGWLASKVYDDGHGPSYTYTGAGRLASRIWARGITTAYNYNNAGSLTNIAYSDSTSSVTNSYDRLGRLISVTSSDGLIESLTYNLANELLNDSFNGGLLTGLSVTNGYDQFLRRTNLTVLGGSVLSRTAYSYDSASRLLTVNDENNDAETYSYVANSPLVSQIDFKQSGTTRMTTTKSYDYLNRLIAIASQPSASGLTPVAFSYTYNTANQRTKNVLTDGSYWMYQYDTLGQVTNGVKYFYDGTLVPGQQFGYLFDDIGNRKLTLAGGDAAGSNKRLASYTVNNLNQVTERDYLGTNDVVGAALATNSVTVNGQTAWRKGEYFQGIAKTNNTASAQWVGVSISSGGSTTTGNLYFPQTPEQFKYDLDGNLTNDGRWIYVWDGENRLLTMTVNTNVGPQYKLMFAYDAQDRRIQKTVATNSVALSTNKFLYDGWNLVAELNPNNTMIRSYMWGNDLSGSQQGAGGVGGLLGISYYGSSTTNCFPAFDGNGNISALINAADGTVAANYDYAAFGEPIRITGAMAKLNPFRFSTKYADNESDLLYYGYRYYKPSTGTWPNRDPLGELGGKNLLYGFADNDGINKGDSDGGELIEAGASIVADLAVQISLNVATGEHWYNISVSGVIVAGAWGLVGLPDIKDIGTLAKGLRKAGQVSARIEKTSDKIALKSTPKAIDQLAKRLARQTNERANALAKVYKNGTLILSGEVLKKVVEEIGDSAESGVVEMPGCPNPGYSINTTVNIVETVTIYIPAKPIELPPIQLLPFQ